MSLENKFQVDSKKNLKEIIALQGVITLGFAAAGWLTYKIINHFDEINAFVGHYFDLHTYF